MSVILDRHSPTRAGYTVRDEFTTDLAAGAVNGTNAVPGPGARVVTDTNSKLALSSGAASFATGGAGAANPGLWYGAQTLQAGLIALAEVTHTSQGYYVAWDTDQSGLPTIGITANATTVSVRLPPNIAVGTVATSTAYRLAANLRTTGAYYFIKGGAFTNWSLLYISATSAGAATVYPGLVAAGISSVFTAPYFRVPSSRWLPIPLASDGFSSFTVTDGLGHAEGIAGGLGAGGRNLPWTQNLGTWQAAAGVASASALSTGVAIATVDTGVADVIATLKYTHVGGTGSVLVRYTSNTNWVRATYTGTNAQLVKNVDGVQTTLIDTAATYAAGAELRISAVGTAFRLYYNDALIGAEQTIADAGLQSGTRQGIRSTDTGNTYDDFVVYARGSGNEYAALDSL